jgi:hypothetical protein
MCGTAWQRGSGHWALLEAHCYLCGGRLALQWGELCSSAWLQPSTGTLLKSDSAVADAHSLLLIVLHVLCACPLHLHTGFGLTPRVCLPQWCRGACSPLSLLRLIWPCPAG